jgi:hypothetical protein
MFEVQGKYLIWGDSQYEIPAEFLGRPIAKIYGTATSGLSRQQAIFLRVRQGTSVEVSAEAGNISGRLVGDYIPPRGTLVYLREQLEPVTGQTFWLVSSKEIKNEVNWLNIEFEDGARLVLCPFTMDYGVVE